MNLGITYLGIWAHVGNYYLDVSIDQNVHFRIFREKFLPLWQLNFQKIPPPMLIWDPTAINFHGNFHPLCQLGTLR